MVGQVWGGLLPFVVEEVGSHWSPGVEADVVAVNWPGRENFLDECKWGEEEVEQGVL